MKRRPFLPHRNGAPAKMESHEPADLWVSEQKSQVLLPIQVESVSRAYYDPDAVSQRNSVAGCIQSGILKKCAIPLFRSQMVRNRELTPNLRQKEGGVT